MNPKSVLAVFLVLGAIWTGAWAWVMASSRVTLPYGEVAPRVTGLRRRLVYPVLGTALVVFLVSLNWMAYPATRTRVLGPPRASIDVSGVQWAWALSSGEVPAGVPVEFRVTAQDVNHGFGIYDPTGRLRTQVQAMPGYTNRLIAQLDQPGEYTVRCLEYCGVGHHLMVTTLTVRAPSEATEGGGRR